MYKNSIIAALTGLLIYVGVTKPKTVEVIKEVQVPIEVVKPAEPTFVTLPEPDCKVQFAHTSNWGKLR